jgi:glutamyl-tRNA reductase
MPAVSVVVVGLEHQSAPLETLERVAVRGTELDEVLTGLRDRENLAEVVVLSTCLRTEIYAVVDRFHDAVFELQELLAKRAELALEDLESCCLVRFDDDVAAHLFAVAAGLESAVVGESEVLGQVRRAWEASAKQQTSGPVLTGLFREAVRVGRRARHETAIGRGTTSFAHAAVALAASRFDGGLVGRRVAVVGAGEIGAKVLDALVGDPPELRPAQVVVASRSRARARTVAGRTVAREVVTEAFDQLPAVAEASDVIFCALDVSGPVLGAAQLAPAGDRSNSPLVIVDLGVPRNVDPELAGVPGVSVLGMDALKEAVARSTQGRRAELEAVAAICQQELDRYRAEVRGRSAAPVIAALRAKLEELRAAELERQRAAVGLDEEAWARVEEASRAALAKILHRPSVLLKESAGTPRGERLVEALRVLFDL